MFTINVIDSGPCHGIDELRSNLRIRCDYQRDSSTFGSSTNISFTIRDEHGTHLGKGATLEEAFEDAAATLISEQFIIQREKEEAEKLERDRLKALKVLKKKGK